MEHNFPNHTPTLHRLRHIHPFWFPPKMDNFWPIELLWAIMAQRVFRSPRPQKIAAVMRRVREECRSFDEKILTKLIHELPAKMNEIRRLKGKKILFACKCSICTSWFDNFPPSYLQPPTKTNKPRVLVAQGRALVMSQKSKIQLPSGMIVTMHTNVTLPFFTFVKNS